LIYKVIDYGNYIEVSGSVEAIGINDSDSKNNAI
jgi:hypothetical protein